MPGVPRAQVPVVIPEAPRIGAKSWILMDANSGDVITEHEADKRLPPASLTKLMTAYMIERELSEGRLTKQDLVTVSEKAWRKGGSKMFIEVGKQIPVSELLKGIVVVSGNDASIAMAEHLAGSEDAFANMMNTHAPKLGMMNTHFENATGWPGANHYSSARDMALLSQHIINDYPEHYSMYSQREFTFNDITQPNRNKLLWRDSSVDGLKTGWTQEAGYGLVSSAKRDDMRLISVVFGAKSPDARVQGSQTLLSYGFRYFDTLDFADAGSVLDTPRVWGGKQNSVKAGLVDDIVMTVPRHDKERVSHSIEMQDDLTAPIELGDVLGTLTVTLDDEVLESHDIVAMESVEKGGFVKRIVDSIRKFFGNLFG